MVVGVYARHDGSDVVMCAWMVWMLDWVVWGESGSE